MVILGLCLLLLSGACSKKDSSSFSVSADYLNLTGTITDSNLQPISGVGIFLPGIDSPITFANEYGEFDVTISDRTLKTSRDLWSQRLRRSSKQFRVVFQSEEAGLAAISGLMSYNARGTKELDSIVLEPTASLAGQVNQFSEEGDVLPAAGLDVYAAHKAARTGVDGKFILEGLPLGTLNLIAIGENTSIAESAVALETSTLKNLDAPIVVFPANAIGGWITPLPAAPLKELHASGHPYQRSFSVSHAPLVKFMRFHHDQGSFDKNLGDAAWQPVKKRIDYDFPGNGGHSLYVQFSDGSKTKTSRVLTIQSNVNIFPDDAGVVIGDGSGLITNRSAKISIAETSFATKMRLHQIREGLEQVEWVPIANVYQYNFAPPIHTGTALVSIHVQFADASGKQISPVYSASAILEIFPRMEEPVVLIEGGAISTPNRMVHLAIKLPPNAAQMTVSDSPITTGAGGNVRTSIDPLTGRTITETSGGGEAVWYPAAEDYFYTFDRDGLKQLYVQFRDIDGVRSPVYSGIIRVLPFDPLELTEGFVINGGAPTTPVREVSLQILPPQGAVAYRVRQNEPPKEYSQFSSADPWLALENSIPFVLSGQGVVTLYMDFVDLNGEQSTVYQQSILYDPFAGNPGDMLINGGAGFTPEPILIIEVMPPLGATEMAIVEIVSHTPGSGSGSGHQENWQSITPTTTFVVQDIGSHTIGVKFRNLVGDESPLIAETIVYDPFPAPYGPFSINNGVGTTMNQNVDLDFFLPPSAYEMKISTDPSLSFQDPWLVVTNSTQFLLPEQSDVYTLYVKYRTIDGHESPTFTAQIELINNPFPAPYGTFTINGGAATTTDNNVTLDIDLPPNAAEMIITTNPLIPGPWLVADSQTQFVLPATPQVYTIYIQYRSNSGDHSSTYTAQIEVQ